VLAGAPSLIDGSLGDRNVVLQCSRIGLFYTMRLSFDIEDLSNWRYWGKKFTQSERATMC
jgi:hypothetical protein